MISILADGPLRRAQQQAFEDEAVNAGNYVGCTSSSGKYVWRHDGNRLTWIGGDAPRHHAHAMGEMIYRLDPDRTLKECLLGMPGVASDATLHRMRLEPCQFHPRIARPTIDHPWQTPGTHPNAAQFVSPMLGTLNQLRTLVELLERILGSVHPIEENLGCYGSNIRNLLILSSTECEAQWKGVLQANGYVSKGRLNRTHYRKLDQLMRLSEYKIGLSHYPWLPAVLPFEHLPDPNASDWYDDYNSVKHDRENDFRRASLRSAIAAVCANWIMAIAQFGFDAMNEFSDLRAYFRFEEGPSWRFSDLYIPRNVCPDGWLDIQAFAD